MTSEKNNKELRVLIVPLNWGLGHATRLIPIITEFRKQGAILFVAGSPIQKALFQEEFDNLNYVSLPYLKIHLSAFSSQILSLTWQFPKFLVYYFNEHRKIKAIVRNEKIDIIIADNCYGAWNEDAYSIFITHQVNIRLPSSIKFLTGIVNTINHWLIAKFDKCLIPDIEQNPGFAGSLSHPVPVKINAKYIGILSRFRESQMPSNERKQLLILLSGPEPQRSLLESIITKDLDKLSSHVEYAVVRGLPMVEISRQKGWYNHLSSHELAEMMACADYIICRPGYSTIMDLVALKKTALFVPTPGQTEQEYLAELYESAGRFCIMLQSEFNLKNAMEKLNGMQDIVMQEVYRSIAFIEEIIVETLKKQKSNSKYPQTISRQ